jgi:two-component system response regulator RegA
MPDEPLPRAFEGASILIVDDDTTLRERLAVALAARGLEPRTAGSYEQALALAEAEPPELAVLDLRMPGRSGLELLRALKQLDAETHVVVLTAYGSIATTIDAMKLGAVYYLQKPADADDTLGAFGRKDPPAAGEAADAFAAPSLERVRWEHISRVLSDCDGNVRRPRGACTCIAVHCSESCRNIRLANRLSYARTHAASMPPTMRFQEHCITAVSLKCCGRCGI